MFWPFLLLAALVMFGWSTLAFLTGGKGINVLATSPMGTPVSLPHGPDESPVRIWLTGGDANDRSVDCTFEGGHTPVFEEFSQREMVGPDGRTYALAARLGRPYVEGLPMTCTSPSGATALLLAQDAGRTTMFTTVGAGAVGLGAIGLAAIGYRAAHRPAPPP